MADIGQLERIARLLGEESCFRDIVALSHRNGMISEYDGRLSYMPLPHDGSIVQKHVVPFMDIPLGPDIEMDLIMFADDMPPHYHSTSDGAVLVRTTDIDGWLGWQQYIATGNWKTLANGEVILLPRGTAHGFRRMPKETRPLYAISINYPPLPDSDITFL